MVMHRPPTPWWRPLGRFVASDRDVYTTVSVTATQRGWGGPRGTYHGGTRKGPGANALAEHPRRVDGAAERRARFDSEPDGQRRDDRRRRRGGERPGVARNRRQDH